MKEELAIRAATVFKDLFPEHWEHDRHYSYHMSNTSCLKCKCMPCELDKPCTVPTPIDINWDNAKRLIKETDPALFMAELKVLWKQIDDACTFGEWVALYATSRHHILAACIAKEKSNEAM